MNTGLVYIIAGVPGSGKTWVCDRVVGYTIVKNDDHIGKDYARAIRDALSPNRPVLAEAPFSLSTLESALSRWGIETHSVFLVEDSKVLIDRYWEREKRLPPNGHLTRQKTFADRAKTRGAFFGTSSEVLNYLNSLRYPSVK